MASTLFLFFFFCSTSCSRATPGACPSSTATNPFNAGPRGDVSPAIDPPSFYDADGRLVTTASCRIKIQRPDRRSPTYDKNSGQKSTGPGALSSHPGAGYRFEQFIRDNKKQPEQAARGDHGDIEKRREPGCHFLCVPEPPEFSCYPRAEVLEHVFPYP